MDPHAALSTLQTDQDLSILTISHPILASLSPSTKRFSAGSANSDLENRTPSALQADLQHYRDLFAKLRFSYVEQVTKERFLRAVTADPPEFVGDGENAELEEKLRGDKAALKEKKEEVRGIVGELEAQGRSLASRHTDVQLQTSQLSELLANLPQLDTHISALRASQPTTNANPDLNLSLPSTLSLLATRETELASLEAQITALKHNAPAQRGRIAGLEDELGPLESRKNAATKAASESLRRKAEGGPGDEMEMQGRWLRGVEGGLRGMLEV